MTQMSSAYNEVEKITGQPEPSFAAFLHCPQNFPSEEEKVAMTAAMMAEKFGCPDPKDTVTELLRKYINSSAELESTGLRAVYQQIRNHIVDKNLFYLILVGYYEMRDNSPELCKYITPKGHEITLTVESVCVALMKEFFSDYEERERLTLATPNFEIYYNTE